MENHSIPIEELAIQENKNEDKTETSSINLTKPIFSKNPRDFKSKEDMFQFLKSLNLKGTRKHCPLQTTL